MTNSHHRPHLEPVQAAGSQGAPTGELQQPPAVVRPQVVQVRVHGVGATPEVEVVGVEEGRLVLEATGDLGEGEGGKGEVED